MPGPGGERENGSGLKAGLWEELLTGELRGRLDRTELIPEVADLADGEAADRHSRHLAAVVARVILDLPEEQQAAAGARLVAELLHRLGREHDEPDGRVLHALWERLPTGEPRRLRRPLTPVLDTTVLTNAHGEPSLAHELRAEIESANAIDMVVAFLRRSGVRPLAAELRRHTSAGKRLRVLTTTYTGSTEALALDDLAALGAEVRVSYETGATRLHAKSWIFQRAPSTTTAYLGSSNLTRTAQQTGLEWNVRVSAARNPDVIDKLRLVVDSYWENGDFVHYDRAEFVRRTSEGAGTRFSLHLSPAGIELRPYQDTLLERIEVARGQGHHRNLLVAATGTGKTVMAAVDYRRLRRRLPRARLLFVAHREELLRQSRATFAHAVGEGGFGELWVGGRRPVHFEHVFASIQSLSAADLADLPDDHFDVVVVDEFHHAHAPTYRRLLDHLRPTELLGLTATPEGSDGTAVAVAFFGGRIAAELRLWDAVDSGYLVPFAYYGVHDGTDLGNVPWRRGRGYEPAALTSLYTADHAWVRLVIAEVLRTVSDVHRMRALGFCVTVAHARWMADRFNEAGIREVAISGDTDVAARRSALRDLASGNLSVVFAVDLLNEGIDVPEVDTLLMLRPTESGTLFLQQLGRGLRRADGKAVCTVLDFVGNQRREFRYDRKYRAMLGGISRTRAQRAIEGGFPFLPAGCSADLDPVAQQVVLRSIRESLPSTWPARVADLRSLGDVDLATFLDETGLDLEDVYATGRSWTALRAAAGLAVPGGGEDDAALLRAVGRLGHVDDPDRIAAYRSLLEGAAPPDLASLAPRDRRLARMLFGSLSTMPAASPLEAGLTQVWAHPQVRAEARELLGLLAARLSHLGADLGPALVDVPLRVHARYTRIEVLAALGAGAGGLAPPAWQSGVWHEASVPADVLAFTLDKSRGGFSPTTRYRDAALSPELVRWERQTATSVQRVRCGRRVTGVAADRRAACTGTGTVDQHRGSAPCTGRPRSGGVVAEQQRPPAVLVEAVEHDGPDPDEVGVVEDERQAPRHGVEARRLWGVEARVGQIGLVDDPRDVPQHRVVQPVVAQHRLEGAVGPVVGELHPGDVERDRLARKRRAVLDEGELRLDIDEPADEPGAGDAIDMAVGPGHPAHQARSGPVEADTVGLGACRLPGWEASASIARTARSRAGGAT